MGNLPMSGTVRNIPAYAGKTYHQSGQQARVSEHPRVCGENNIAKGGRDIAGGTSPRMRGKPNHVSASGVGYRNIPAYAGKTLSWSHSTLSSEEHPRVCGENLVERLAQALGGGTSPRMRGKPLFPWLPIPSVRNIPAYAGKT